MFNTKGKNMEENKISVSVVIPIYIINSELLLMTKKCIDDIKFKTIGVDFEIIIVDDDSPEKKMTDILRKKYCSDIIWISNKTNKGFAHTINRGIAAATKDLILLLNNDICIIDNKWLINMINIMKINGWDMTAPEYGEIDANNEYIPKNKRNKYGGQRFQYLAGWCLLSKRSVFEQIGLFPTIFNKGYWEDTLYSRIVQNKKYKIGVANNIGIKHLEHRTFLAAGYSLPKIYNENRNIYIEAIKSGKAELPQITEYTNMIKDK